MYKNTYILISEKTYHGTKSHAVLDRKMVIIVNTTF